MPPSCVKLDVLSAMHFIAETWKLITLTTVKTVLKSVVYQLIMSTARGQCTKTHEDEENDWDSLQLVKSAV